MQAWRATNNGLTPIEVPSAADVRELAEGTG